MTSKGPLQPKAFYDSMIHFFSPDDTNAKCLGFHLFHHLQAQAAKKCQ